MERTKLAESAAPPAREPTAPGPRHIHQEVPLRETVRAGDVVEATVASYRPRTIYVHVDREPWPGGDGNTVLSDGTGEVAVRTDSVRVYKSAIRLAADVGLDVWPADPRLRQCGICGGVINADPCAPPPRPH
jgi:hypothetical protein